MIAEPASEAQPRPGDVGRAEPVIATTALTRRFGASITALDELTMAVGAGITGLVGANGAGKSTLIKILLGLLPPTSGKASVLGMDTTAHGERIRSLTGYMPEHDCLPPDVTATEFVTHMYRQIGTYSTGMKQRVKLAQALAGDPRLLLLDEPTNGLDPAGRTAMLDLICRIGGDFGISVVVSSHLLGEIEQICDHLIVIDGGRLLRSATMSSFTQASQVLVIEVDEGADLLAAELSGRGLDPVRSGRELLLLIDGDAMFDLVRDSVARLGLPLTRMEQRRHRVEELFRDDGGMAGLDEPGGLAGSTGLTGGSGLTGAADGH